MIVYYPSGTLEGMCYIVEGDERVDQAIKYLRETGRCVTATFPYRRNGTKGSLMRAVSPIALYR